LPEPSRTSPVAGCLKFDVELSNREPVKRLRRPRATKQSTSGVKPLSGEHDVTAKHRRVMMVAVLIRRDSNAAASGFRRSSNHHLLLAAEHRHSGDGVGVVKSG